MNTAEYERLLGDAVSGIERTEALGHTTLGKIRRQHETIGYAARRSDDTRRITQDAKKSLRALYCRLLREKLCLSTTIAILFTIDVARREYPDGFAVTAAFSTNELEFVEAFL